MSNISNPSGKYTFSSFWAHYNAADKWRKKHRDMVEESYLSLQSPSGTSTKLVKDAKSVNGRSAPVKTPEIEEIDAEYAAFKLITEEHQKKHYAQKIVEEEKDVGGHWISATDDYILADQIGVNGILNKTVEDPDEKTKTILKRKIAHEKYGNAAEKLLAMETALDVQFSQIMSWQQPPMWPNIPLRL